MPPALNSHELIPAHTPKEGRIGRENGRERERCRVREEKTEVKEDPKKKDIIKLCVRVHRTSILWKKDMSTILL